MKVGGKCDPMRATAKKQKNQQFRVCCTFPEVKGKVKFFPYSLPIVRPGADPGVQAVSPQVT